jgi:hypothetical protein
VLNTGYDDAQRETSLSATVAGTLDFLNNYTYDADNELTQVTQQGQTGGNSVAAKLVNFTYDHDGNVLTVSRYANLAATQLVDTSTYGYNANGLLTSLSEDKGSTNFNTYTWSYDHDSRLAGDTVGAGSDSYTYLCSCQLREWDYLDYSEKSAVVVWVAPQLARNSFVRRDGSSAVIMLADGLCEFATSEDQSSLPFLMAA